MNKRQIIEKLNKFKALPVQEQIIDERDNILELFKLLWDLNATEDEFRRGTEGLVLFPEMIHYMVKHK